MPAPVNVKIPSPSVKVAGWGTEAREWKTLNAQIGGHKDFSPLTIKAAYVLGVIHILCRNVSTLLDARVSKELTSIPAYGIFASAVELLGRCINGNTGTSKTVEDVRTGFKWLKSPSSAGYQQVSKNSRFITTNNNTYSIDNLTYLRHFAAHGQATVKDAAISHAAAFDIDEILGLMPPILAPGLDEYWHELWDNEEFCNKLGMANIIRLRNLPIKIIWMLFERDRFTGKYHSVADVFNEFDWVI